MNNFLMAFGYRKYMIRFIWKRDPLDFSDTAMWFKNYDSARAYCDNYNVYHEHIYATIADWINTN